MKLGEGVMMYILSCPECERRAPINSTGDDDDDEVECVCGCLYSTREVITQILALVRRYDVQTFDVDLLPESENYQADGEAEQTA